MTRAHGPRSFGDGPLSRVSAFVYTMLAVQAMLVLASLPGLVPLYLLTPDVGNIPLAAACLVPVGPALSAAVYALRHRRSDLTELRPVAQYWQGYRLNWRTVLPIWLAGLAWLAILGLTLGNFWASGLPRWWAGLLLVIALLTLLWLTNGLVVTSLFDFRTRDAMKLAWELIPRKPLAALGNLGVLLGAGLLARLTGDAVVIALAAGFVLVLVHTSRPLIDLVTAEYTA
jgi:hypothetical protein